MDDRERRIRDEAYLLWVDAGRPDGEASSHWLEAEKRLEAEEAAGGAPARPATKRGGEAPVVAKNAGNSGVAAEATVTRPKSKRFAAANDPAPADQRALKGEPVDIAPARRPRARKPGAGLSEG